MTDILIRKLGQVGHITLNRPHALNALTQQMCLDIEAALDAWSEDATVALVLIDGTGDRAFSAGGDIAMMYARAKDGDHAFGRQFFRDEYRMNARMAEFPKPVIAFLHGFVMGGGVGVGCHGTHRIVGSSTRIAMPECGIGLVPDVGSTLILARAPGRLGEYLGLTGDRMDAGDALHAGFGSHFISETAWPALKEALIDTGDCTLVDKAAQPAPGSRLAGWAGMIDTCFGGDRLADIYAALEGDASDAAQHALDLMARKAPLSMAAAIMIVHRVRAQPDIRHALEQEYRFSHRASEHGDFLEGIRAAIIDKDRQPKWKHAGWREADDHGVQVDAGRMIEPPHTEPLELDKVQR